MQSRLSRRRKRLTSRSSREWKLITTSRPPGDPPAVTRPDREKNASEAIGRPCPQHLCLRLQLPLHALKRVVAAVVPGEEDALRTGGMFVATSGEINPPVQAENFRAMVEAVGKNIDADFEINSKGECNAC